MDYIKLIIFLFTNFAIIIFLVLAAMIKFEARKKILKNPEPVKGVDCGSCTILQEKCKAYIMILCMLWLENLVEQSKGL